jgi:6-pyruvoyl-tetrahydropterin synthase
MKCAIFFSLFSVAAAFVPIARKTVSTAVSPIVPPKTSSAIVSVIADPKMSPTALKMDILDFMAANSPLAVFLTCAASVVTILGDLKANTKELKNDFIKKFDEQNANFIKKFDEQNANTKELKDDFIKKFDEQNANTKELKNDFIKKFDEQNANTKELKDDFIKKFDEQNANTNKRLDSIDEKINGLKDELKAEINAGINGIKEVFEVKFEAQEKILDAKINGHRVGLEKEDAALKATLKVHGKAIDAHGVDIDALKKKIKEPDAAS